MRREFSLGNAIVSIPINEGFDATDMRRLLEDAIREYAERFDYDVRIDQMDVGVNEEPSLSVEERQ